MKYLIKWMYSSPKKKNMLFTSDDETDLDSAISIGEDLEKTGRVKSIEFIDTRGTPWSLKELKKLKIN